MHCVMRERCDCCPCSRRSCLQAQSHQGELYRRTPPEQLDWARRWGLMAAEIQHHAPDLVCLQEVDHWDSVAADMSQLG